ITQAGVIPACTARFYLITRPRKTSRLFIILACFRGIYPTLAINELVILFVFRRKQKIHADTLTYLDGLGGLFEHHMIATWHKRQAILRWDNDRISHLHF